MLYAQTLVILRVLGTWWFLKNPANSFSYHQVSKAPRFTKFFSTFPPVF